MSIFHLGSHFIPDIPDVFLRCLHSLILVLSSWTYDWTCSQSLACHTIPQFAVFKFVEGGEDTDHVVNCTHSKLFCPVWVNAVWFLLEISFCCLFSFSGMAHPTYSTYVGSLETVPTNSILWLSLLLFKKEISNLILWITNGRSSAGGGKRGMDRIKVVI